MKEEQEELIIYIMKFLICMLFLFMFCGTLFSCGIMKGKVFMETENVVCTPKNRL